MKQMLFPWVFRLLLKRRRGMMMVTIFLLAFSSRYYFKYYNYTEQSADPDNFCLNITVIEIKENPSIQIFLPTTRNLNWQFVNDVDKHIIRTGIIRNETAFLTIGIPSIKRVVNSTYILNTLDSLESSSTEVERSKTICVVFLCDLDQNYNELVEQQIVSAFGNSIKSGFVQVVKVNQDFYPNLDGLKQNFKDPPDRVRWRAKQVADYILLFRYCSSLSHYHLQIEDDVSSVKHYIRSIELYIKAVTFKEILEDINMIAQEMFTRWPGNTSLFQTVTYLNNLNKNGYPDRSFEGMQFKARWTSLDFSELGFIGKLFRSNDLEKLATFLSFYYDEQPIDWLIIYFLKSMGQSTKYLHIPTLFQHFGLKSSFNHHQDNKLKDKLFNKERHEILLSWADKRLMNINNPLAILFTNLSYKEFPVENFYIPSYLFYFKATDVKINESILVFFTEKQSIGKIVIETGLDNKDCLENASILIGTKSEIKNVNTGEVSCSETSRFVNFSGCLNSFVLNKRNVSCIVLVVEEGNGKEVVFTNLLVFPLQ